MEIEQVVMEAGRILPSRQRLHEDVDVWAKELFEEAGLPFTPASIDIEENSAPQSFLSVMHSQPATPKAEAQPKRKSRRVYLDLAIQCFEKGSYTHRELVESIIEQYPNLNRETVSTFVSDVQNPQYSPIKTKPWSLSGS